MDVETSNTEKHLWPFPHLHRDSLHSIRLGDESEFDRLPDVLVVDALID